MSLDTLSHVLLWILVTLFAGVSLLTVYALRRLAHLTRTINAHVDFLKERVRNLERRKP